MWMYNINYQEKLLSLGIKFSVFSNGSHIYLVSDTYVPNCEAVKRS